MRRSSLLTIFFSTCVLVSLWYVAYSFNESASVYTLVFDDSFSVQLRHAIADFIRTKNIFTLSSVAVCAQLARQFNQIGSIILESRGPKAVSVVLTSVKPQAVLNGQHVVDQSGAVLSLLDFTQQAVVAVPTLEVCEPIGSSVSTELMKFLARLDPTVTNMYHIEWHDLTKVYFSDKKNAFVRLLVTAASGLNREVFERLDFIKNLLSARSAREKNRGWIADMRFDNQVVVYPLLGEKR